MPTESLIPICAAIFAVAFLYSSVGHAGASGYIAIMTLFGLAPAIIKPAALVLNIMVACLAAWQFWQAGYFSWKLFWPFALLSVPFAFLGGFLDLPVHVFKIVIGIVLLYSAIRFLLQPGPDRETREPSKTVSLSIGAGIGFLSGLTGVGGGIFLTPLVISMRWARTKTASAVSALFILVNSASGLLGNWTGTGRLPSLVLPLAIAAIAGGAIGSHLGSRRFSVVGIKRLLAVVLLIAGFKLIFT